MNTAASMNDALSSRIFAWMDERFPFKNALLFFILYLASATVARSTLEGGIPSYANRCTCLCGDMEFVFSHSDF